MVVHCVNHEDDARGKRGPRVDGGAAEASSRAAVSLSTAGGRAVVDGPERWRFTACPLPPGGERRRTVVARYRGAREATEGALRCRRLLCRLLIWRSRVAEQDEPGFFFFRREEERHGWHDVSVVVTWRQRWSCGFLAEQPVRQQRWWRVQGPLSGSRAQHVRRAHISVGAIWHCVHGHRHGHSCLSTGGKYCKFTTLNWNNWGITPGTRDYTATTEAEVPHTTTPRNIYDMTATIIRLLHCIINITCVSVGQLNDWNSCSESAFSLTRFVMTPRTRR